MNKLLNIVMASALLLGLANCSSKKGQQKAAARGNAVVAVDVVVVKPRPLDNNLEATGTLLPNEKIEVQSQVAGRVVAIGFKEGQKVKKGQMLIHIDDREWKAQLQKLQVQQDLAEKDLKRKKSLFEVNGVSQEVLDQAETDLASIKASIAEVQVEIDHATITAPFSGRIGLRSVSEGEFISPDQTIAVLVENNPIKLEFNVPEKYSYDLKVGQSIDFTVEGQKDTFQAEIYAFEPQVDPTSRAVTVRAKADNTDELLFPGTFADVTLTLARLDQALLVPTEAIIPEINGQKVFLIKKGIVQESQVEMGIRTGSAVQLSSGVDPGDTVLITGLLQVHPGMPVTVRNIVPLTVSGK